MFVTESDDEPFDHDPLDDGSDPSSVAPLVIAPPAAGKPQPRNIDDALPQTGRLLLVGCMRPADAVHALRWSGALNHESDPGRLGAVLRSWEERFGAYVVRIGLDTLTLGVERPPSAAEAPAVAREHHAFCPDNIDQSSCDGDVDAYAAAIAGHPRWDFWWD
ncbi:MAG TPA: DUF4253 domain-containing protein [Kofleriaceae bacterium]